MVQASHFVLGAPGAPTVVSSYHQIRSTPPGRPGSSGQWRWYFHCVHPRSGAQASTKRTALAAKRSFVFRFFKRLCTDTRLLALSWRPYSLRRGGATAHFLEHGSLDKTAVRGRWPSTKTARIYINEAVSTFADHAHHPSANFHRQMCQNHPSTGYVEEILSRSQHPKSRGGRARFLCSGSCRQWRLQQCEVSPLRDRGGPHMPRFRECGGPSDSADQDLRITGVPSQPRYQVLWLSCSKKK